MELVQHYLTLNPCYVANVNKADSRYTTFQKRGPLGLMLHSVGCAQPSASVFLNGWNKPTYTNSCVHGIIDANTGVAYQCLPWNFRGWHGGGSSNNTHIGIEMCESAYIRYLKVGETGYSPGKFQILDKAKAQADCKRCYDTAVELYASICKQYNLNPLTDICSHKEGHSMGIATNHGDPEHYWKGLRMAYTMNGFRQDVKAKMEGDIDMTVDEFNALFDQKVVALKNQLINEFSSKLTTACKSLSESYGRSLEDALTRMIAANDELITERIGKQIVHNQDIPWASVRAEMRKLLDIGAINGGTDASVDPDDIRLPLNLVRVLVVCAKYSEMLISGLREELGFASPQSSTEA